MILLFLLPFIARAQQIAVNGNGGCVLAPTQSFNASQVECWGVFLLQFNAIINPNPSSLTNTNFVSIATTQNAACGIFASGYLSCWGDSSLGIMNYPPLQFKQITLGNWNCGILLLNNSLACWGNNVNPNLLPTSVNNVTSLSTNGYQTCLVYMNSSATCFGLSPTIIPPMLNSVLQVAAGNTHTCLLYVDNSVGCFGTNTYGESTPPAGNFFISITAGNEFTCGIRIDYTVLCFGINTAGQSAAPSGLFFQISASNAMVCGLLTKDYSVLCWGSNVYGEQNPPSVSITNINNLRLGFSHACVIRYDGALLCYGNNNLGELNIPYNTYSIDTLFVACGNQFTCTVTKNNIIYCFGDNSANQISNVPTINSGTNNWTGIYSSSNSLTICASTSNNVTCWGLCTLNRCSPPNGLQTSLPIAVGVGGSCAIQNNSQV